jgi:hypothetical protein
VKWDIDRAIAPYEPITIPGTTFQRVLMAITQVRKEGLKIPSDKTDGESMTVWQLAVGCNGMPKHFVYGHTMRECFLRLRRAVRIGAAPLNPQLFPRLGKKKKRKERR